MNSLALLRTSTGPSDKIFFDSRVSASTSKAVYRPSKPDYIKSFYSALRRWKSETAFYSNPDKITEHVSYLQIVAHADLVLPLIIAELRIKPSLLVWALDDAFPDRPYGQDVVGNITEMTNAWINWADRNGHKL